MVYDMRNEMALDNASIEECFIELSHNNILKQLKRGLKDVAKNKRIAFHTNGNIAKMVWGSVHRLLSKLASKVLLAKDYVIVMAYVCIFESAQYLLWLMLKGTRYVYVVIRVHLSWMVRIDMNSLLYVHIQLLCALSIDDVNERNERIEQGRMNQAMLWNLHQTFVSCAATPYIKRLCFESVQQLSMFLDDPLNTNGSSLLLLCSQTIESQNKVVKNAHKRHLSCNPHNLTSSLRGLLFDLQVRSMLGLKYGFWKLKQVQFKEPEYKRLLYFHTDDNLNYEFKNYPCANDVHLGDLTSDEENVLTVLKMMKNNIIPTALAPLYPSALDKRSKKVPIEAQSVWDGEEEEEDEDEEVPMRDMCEIQKMWEEEDQFATVNNNAVNEPSPKKKKKKARSKRNKRKRARNDGEWTVPRQTPRRKKQRYNAALDSDDDNDE